MSLKVFEWDEDLIPTHGDYALDINGHDVIVGRSSAGETSGKQIKRQLDNGIVTVLSKNKGLHTSTRNTKQSVGYTYTSTPYARDAAIRVIHLDGNKEFRASPTYAADDRESNVQHEPQASVSPDGTRVIWASDWGNPRGSVSAYVVKLCDNTTPSHLPGDANRDGSVNFIDNNLILQYFHQDECTFNLIGTSCLIDIFDYNNVIEYFGT